MTITVDVREAKTHLSRLLARVGLGEEVIIAHGGVPIARLVPISPPVRHRVLGTAAGKITVAPDFDAPLPDSIILEFEP